ncbi:nucleoside-binding protein [Caloramator quimbayensis]|uniref:Nucleoside-binding protein n=1 Tax=Caloramator quimbayensis TaxID=1147123 RepID=A0A1T4XH42_9CLOT|nr:BMP family ABC transporter substrate-binding protein [Caloramator quimbayensis]SKA88809.1 nucleoside-binding protein [Caloramator quimbayensis]
MGSYEHYDSARKKALKEYTSNISKGNIGYLPSLEGILKDVEIVSQVELGTFEIPLKKIVGTYSHARSLAFAKNFMPLVDNDSEFKEKWSNLCQIQLDEGIRDPIKVYEYMNWFYVIEGNKRVSVLKYLDAYSISASITRLIPKKNPDDIDNQIYYEFLDFNNKTKLYSIWFTKKKRFPKLLKLLEDYNPKDAIFNNKYKHFEAYVYNVFRKVYHELGGDNLPITTGDAFLEFAKIYGILDKLEEDNIKVPIKGLIKELVSYKSKSDIDISSDPDELPSPGLIQTLTTLIKPHKILKIAFVYARTIEGSGWTYAHEIGRKYLEDKLAGQVTTSYVEMVPEGDEAYDVIKKLSLDGNDVIFTTSPVFKNATIKCALEHPNIRYFNCSESRPYAHLSNYYGRTYESRFLTGIIAGSMTKTNIIGYSATSPNPEVISAINSFALGAKMVNPYCKVLVSWTREWNSHEKSTGVTEKLIHEGADIISNLVLTIPRKVTAKFGVYSMLCSIDTESKMPDKYLAAPIWHWGVFYEKIVNTILNDTFKTITDMFSENAKLINFYWGLASGVLDIYYSKTHVPLDTQKLIELMKKMIANNDYHPFTGPVYDNNGNIRIAFDETASHEEILSMNWYADNVIADDYI